MKKILQEDIARKLNISRATVSRALNNSEFIKKETKDKILALAKELGYEVNSIAKNLAKKNNYRIIAFLFETIEQGYSQKIINGINKAISQNKLYNIELDIITTKTTEPEVQTEKIQNHLDKIFYEYDAMIIMPLDNQVIDKLVATHEIHKKIPVFIIGMDISKENRRMNIGVNHKRLGKIIACQYNNTMKTKENVLIVESEKEYKSVLMRIQGFLSVIEKDTKIFRYKVAHDNDIRDIKSFIIDNNISFLYSLVYTPKLLAALQHENIVVCCHDYSTIIKESLQSGEISFIVYDNPYIQGYVIMQSIIDDIVLHRKIEKDQIFIKSDILIKENIKESYWF